MSAAQVVDETEEQGHNLVDGGQSTTTGKPSVLTVLETYLDSENGDLRTIAVEGFARLMLLDHLASPQVFSRGLGPRQLRLHGTSIHIMYRSDHLPHALLASMGFAAYFLHFRRVTRALCE